MRSTDGHGGEGERGGHVRSRASGHYAATIASLSTVCNVTCLRGLAAAHLRWYRAIILSGVYVPCSPLFLPSSWRRSPLAPKRLASSDRPSTLRTSAVNLDRVGKSNKRALISKPDNRSLCSVKLFRVNRHLCKNIPSSASGKMYTFFFRYATFRLIQFVKLKKII